MRHSCTLLIVSVALFGLGQPTRAEDPAAQASEKQAVRVGVYDSRAVAYANFLTDKTLDKIKAAYAEAQAAKKAGDLRKLEELKMAMQQQFPA